VNFILFSFLDHTQLDTSHSVGLLWTSDQPEAETSTWQHTTLTTDKHPCPLRDSNQQIPASERPPGLSGDPFTFIMCT